MGTNYYMIMKDKELVTKYFDNEYEFTDLPYFGYEVHIGKRSCGWKPLFEWHENAYKSVDDMLKFLEFHKMDIEIYDEYNEKFSIDGLEEKLHKKMISDEINNPNLNISQLKKRIKYCRNPLEKQSLQRELNTLYKKRKRGV